MINIKIVRGTSYWIELKSNGDCKDRYIAKYLDLSLEEYQNILINNGAFFNNEFGEYYFKTRKDIETAIKELEPYYILAELTR